MQVGIVGCRNHAARLIRILAEMPKVTGISVYHPTNPTIPEGLASGSVAFEMTDEIECLYGVPLVVIAAPNETHLAYIHSLLPHVGRLLCEKPPADSPADLAALRDLAPSDRGRVAFNFSYTHTALANCVRESKLGEFIGAEFVSMHGLAFKKAFGQSWRGKGENAFARIFGNVGIHYVHLVRDLFGPISPIYDLREIAVANPPTIDTAIFSLGLRNGQCATVRLSYASPLVNTARIFFADGYLELRNGEVMQHGPRDVFDASGRFAVPPSTPLASFPSVQAYYDEALKSRVGEVLRATQNGDTFPEHEFESALDATEAILSGVTALSV